MADGRIAFAEGLLGEAVAELRDAMGADALDDEIVAALRVGYRVERELQRVQVGAVAALLRRGVFAQRGQRAEYAVADLLGIDYVEARQVVLPASHDDDDGAIHHADGNRTTRAVVIVTLAAWSSRCRGTAYARGRRRHDGARPRAREDPTGG